MSLWTMIFLIVVVGCVTNVLTERYKALGKQNKAGNGQAAIDQQNAAEAQREIEDLRERIKVLERIATDANTSEAREIKAISDQIEALRDR